MDTKKPFYLTTPIFYPNANLHLGHAYTTTLSDIIVRYHRDILGQKTYFLTGADENTQKVVIAAEKAGMKSREFLNGIVDNFKKLFSDLEISYDQFIRTSDEKVHWPGAQALWKKLDDAGDLEKRTYEGLYCVGHEAFITEKDLVDGKCPDHDMVPEHLKEENYFFKLSRYTGDIKKRIESGELEIFPVSRKMEILSLLESGLEDVSFSRPKTPKSVGVPVPGDDTQVMYVWCDALSNYITALGYGQDDTLYKEFWPADVHVIGKDILRFHAAIWPGMLISAGLPLPKSLLVHGFITSGGKKMSKTLGNVIDPEELLDEYGAEALRYFLARHISPFEDGDITMEGFKNAYNADLANGLGNLTSRIIKMAVAYEAFDDPTAGSVTDDAGMDAGVLPYGKWLDVFDFNKAVEEIWYEIKMLDQQIQEKKPFIVFKTDPKAAKSEVWHLTRRLFRIARALRPFLPETSEKIESALKSRSLPGTLFPRKE